MDYDVKLVDSENECIGLINKDKASLFVDLKIANYVSDNELRFNCLKKKKEVLYWN